MHAAEVVQSTTRRGVMSGLKPEGMHSGGRARISDELRRVWRVGEVVQRLSGRLLPEVVQGPANMPFHFDMNGGAIANYAPIVSPSSLSHRHDTLPQKGIMIRSGNLRACGFRPLHIVGWRPIICL
ncbi:hypothetical protein FIBSPDRAFT_102099 [Athelia psychrophila]|uniref:Uncharacterized protein n=1 Tax=Athelia psychrophila TaxID=1759441 RepID=A0A166DHN3_9AGAM|nr:hypothetical protein FIBSPDRAFT_102099 [Fibularhizoctonia sp. CBS 109695]